MDLKNSIPVVSDWPKPGVNFLDMSGILSDPRAFNFAVNQLSLLIKQAGASSILAIESRGFLFAAPVAKSLALPLILVRKRNKLPGAVYTVTYDTEYSTDSLCIQADAPVGNLPIIVDDLVATGGTILATAQLVRQHWPVDGVCAAALVCLDFLPGRNVLDSNDVALSSVVNYA